MEIEIKLTHGPIAEKVLPPPSGEQGAWLEFRGVVRGEENGKKISALEYEAYPEMAAREIRRLLEAISSRHPCLAAKIIHRIGIIPVGETAIYFGVASAHRAEGIALLAEFMDKLKQDVPIWKRRALPLAEENSSNNSRIEPLNQSSGVSSHLCSILPLPAGEGRGEGESSEPKPASVHGNGGRFAIASNSLDDALAKIAARCEPLPAVRMPLQESLGHILRETVCAPNDLPDCDRSTRDGYAILENDASETFQVVDTLHAADWKPRQLKIGETIRIATGASLPCEGLRVVNRKTSSATAIKFELLNPKKIPMCAGAAKK